MSTYSSYTIGSSCNSNGLLKHHKPLPKTRGVGMDPDALFAYATLKFQDSAMPGLMTFLDTRSAASEMFGVHRRYLSYTERTIVTRATGELQRETSEYIGIGCGIAAFVDATGINPNRITRVEAAGKRLDFQVLDGGRRYLLEVKGTTYATKAKGCLKDIKKKKKASRNFHQAFGAITVYSADKRDNPLHVTIVDPPGSRGAPLVGQVEEVASVLKHYAGLFQTILMHQTTFTEDLVQSINRAVQQDELPAAIQAKPAWRVSERTSDATFLGSLFDARSTRAAARTYASFEAATEALGSRSTFVGVDEQVLALIQTGDWESLMLLRWNHVREEGAEVLPNGVLVKKVPLDEYETQVMRSEFERRRARWLRDGQI